MNCFFAESIMKTIVIKLPTEELLAGDGEVVIHLSRQDITAGNVVTVVGRDAIASSPAPGLFVYMEGIISEMESGEKVRTAETYRSALNSFRRFRLDNDLPLTDFDATMAAAYECWLKKRGIVPNSSSFYMRILRAVYNRAVDAGLTADRHPFSKVYTGIAHTTKRAVNISVIKQLEQFSSSDDQVLFARDMFMFSFYTQGMAFVDMAHLKTSDIRNGTLVYHRQKTGQEISVQWTPQMQQIVDRRPSVCGNYLLPIIGNGRGTERNRLRYCQNRVNQHLKAIAKALNIQSWLTLYVARHSWASIAHSLNIPIEVIRSGMGHASERTTHIYLRDIDNGRLAEANRQVMALL